MRRTIKSTDKIYPLLDYINEGNYCCEWYYIDKGDQTLWFYELRPQNRIACISHEKYPAIPLMDFNGRYGMELRGIGTNASFNPTIDREGKPKQHQNPLRIYFYQEFSVLYSEEELSKLKSITIGH